MTFTTYKIIIASLIKVKNMPVLKSSKETFTFSLSDMKKLICSDLGVSEDKVTVNYKLKDSSGEMDRFSHYVMDEIEVIIDKI